jgi:Oxidoreductase family, NAD-binding Rossmann fold/Oxidoreductase family, C-terminal alpha/beta domain/TAT (twin-arginine translocation) pathway signal sequence
MRIRISSRSHPPSAANGAKANAPRWFSRREFLKASLAVAGAAAFGRPTLLAADAGKKLGVAVIGAGGMGDYSLGESLRENLVAIADVDDNTIANAMKEKVKDQAKPRIFNDYRKMLDECQKDIDVVLIATPDHHHAPAAIRAMQLGKHVFCQKPLAHDIRECYVLAKAAQEKKLCTQMGNQGYCDDGIRRVAEYIAAGAIGDVVESHTVLGRNFGGSGGRPASKPVPANLHWDEWLGAAPYREYHDGLHPFYWRNFRAFGTGTIGDMACHHVAVPFMALRLWEVKQFVVECINTKGGSDEMYPQDNIVCYHIPARPKFPACKLYVYDDHGLRPKVWKDAEEQEGRKFGEYTLFVGSKGMIGSDAKMIPQAEHDRFPKPERTLPRAHGAGPIQDLYWCIRNGGTPASNFPGAAAPLTSIALTGHLAQFAGIGSKVEWDMEKMQCTNLPEINRFVRREYRAGWEV